MGQGLALLMQAGQLGVDATYLCWSVGLHR